MCLVPFSLSNYKPDQFKLPKYLLDTHSKNEMACKKYKKTEIKSCRRISTPKMEAITVDSSKAESTPQNSSIDVHAENNQRHKSTSDTVIPCVEMESSEERESDEDTISGPVRI